MKTLVVDDDEVSRLTLAADRRASGMEVVQAVDGKAARQLLQKGLQPAACGTHFPAQEGTGEVRCMHRHRVLNGLPLSCNASGIRSAALAWPPGEALSLPALRQDRPGVEEPPCDLHPVAVAA